LLFRGEEKNYKKFLEEARNKYSKLESIEENAKEKTAEKVDPFVSKIKLIEGVQNVPI
jgi:hypothetical protein